HELEHSLEKLKLDGYHLHVSRQQRGGIAGTKFDVHVEDGEHEHHHHEEEDEHGHSHEHGHGHSHEHHHSHEHGHHRHEHHHPEDEHEHHHHEHGHEHHGRTFADIRKLISNSSLSPWVKNKAVAVFQRIANAEG